MGLVRTCYVFCGPVLAALVVDAGLLCFGGIGGATRGISAVNLWLVKVGIFRRVFLLKTRADFIYIFYSHTYSQSTIEMKSNECHDI